MKRLAVPLLLLCAVLLSFGTADAKSGAIDFKGTLRAMNGSIVIPPEWSGIWTTTDSVYDCSDQFIEVATSKDTICAGQVVTQIGEIVDFTCTGAVNGTTMDVTCTGSYEPVTDCLVTFTVVTHTTRSGDSFRSVSTTTTTHSGTNPICSFFPEDCKRNVTEGTRTGVAPPAFCATPTKRATWGQLKILYR